MAILETPGTSSESKKSDTPSTSSESKKSEKSSINIFAHRNMNFFTEGVPGGLVFCQAGMTTKVPDDVKDKKLNPLFQDVVDAGYISVVSGDKMAGSIVEGGPPGPTGQPRHAPSDEDVNVERKPNIEDELGPSMSLEEYELRTPVKPPKDLSDKGKDQGGQPDQVGKLGQVDPQSKHDQGRHDQGRQVGQQDKPGR